MRFKGRHFSNKAQRGNYRNQKFLDSDVVFGYGENGELLALEIWGVSKKELKSLKDLAMREKVVETLLKRTCALRCESS